MPFRKFGKYDLIYNQVKTFPESDFVIYDSRVYYNNFKNEGDRAGQFGNLLAVQQGFVSLFELNVDRLHLALNLAPQLGAARDQVNQQFVHAR